LGTLIAACVLLPLLLLIGELVELDTWLFLAVREGYDTAYDDFWRYFTDLGSRTVWLLIVPLLWLARKKEAAVTLLIAILVVAMVTYAMKYAIDRPRPYEVISDVYPLYLAHDPSFPSGHTMNAFAGAVAVGMRWRKALPPLLVLAAAIGFSRVYIGVHYPLDVFTGAIIGALVGLLAASLDLHGPLVWMRSRAKPLAERFSLWRKRRSP